jgi:hypothetical protein
VKKGEIMERKKSYFDDETIACILDFMQCHAQPVSVMKEEFWYKIM